MYNCVFDFAYLLWSFSNLLKCGSNVAEFNNEILMLRRTRKGSHLIMIRLDYCSVNIIGGGIDCVSVAFYSIASVPYLLSDLLARDEEHTGRVKGTTRGAQEELWGQHGEHRESYGDNTRSTWIVMGTTRESCSKANISNVMLSLSEDIVPIIQIETL